MTQSSPQEERPLDPARALDEAIARRARALEELARDIDRIEEELEGGEADAEQQRKLRRQGQRLPASKLYSTNF